MAVVAYDRHLRRVYVRDRRLHHGLVGAGLVLIGVALMLDDRHDWPWPFCIDATS